MGGFEFYELEMRDLLHHKFMYYMGLAFMYDFLVFYLLFVIDCAARVVRQSYIINNVT